MRARARWAPEIGIDPRCRLCAAALHTCDRFFSRQVLRQQCSRSTRKGSPIDLSPARSVSPRIQSRRSSDAMRLLREPPFLRCSKSPTFGCSAPRLFSAITITRRISGLGLAEPVSILEKRRQVVAVWGHLGLLGAGFAGMHARVAHPFCKPERHRPCALRHSADAPSAIVLDNDGQSGGGCHD
jgi:hypothetical protein